MAFDINTAKPASTGFDISTAKPSGGALPQKGNFLDKPLTQQPRELPAGSTQPSVDFSGDLPPQQMSPQLIVNTERKQLLAEEGVKRGLLQKFKSGANTFFTLASLSPSEILGGSLAGETIPEMARDKDPMSAKDSIVGGVDAAGAVGRSMGVLGAAGIAGTAKTYTTARDQVREGESFDDALGAGLEAGQETSSQIQEAGQKYTQPFTEAGEQVLGGAGKMVTPIADEYEGMKQEIGDKTLEITKSPALATFAHIAPDIVADLLGYGMLNKTRKAASQWRNLRKTGDVDFMMKKATPSKELIYKTSDKMYKELSTDGAMIKAERIDSLADDIAKTVKEGGGTKKLTPRAYSIVEDIIDVKGTDLDIDEVNNFRKQASGASKDPHSNEARVAKIIKEKIDDYRSGVTEDDFAVAGKLDPSEIAERYKIADELWGRYKKSKTIDKIFYNAGIDQNFERSLRNQFRALLKNDRKIKFFNKQEIKIMEDLVKGDLPTNILSTAGQLGFSGKGLVQNIIPMMGLTAGTAAGAATILGGPVGAIAVPLIGMVSKSLAKKLTANKAIFADQVARSGANGPKIVKAYINHTPPARRDPKELSELLMRQDIKLNTLPKSKLTQDAKNIVQKRFESARSKLKEERGSMSFEKKLNVDTELDKALPVKQDLATEARKFIPEDVSSVLNDIHISKGLKLGEKTKIWRGVREGEAGQGGATYGEGLYTTTRKSEAKEFAGTKGKVLEMGRESLPDNPLRFDTINEFQIWQGKAIKKLGLNGLRELNSKFKNYADFIRELDPDIDGIQIGKGKDAMFVSYPVD